MRLLLALLLAAPPAHAGLGSLLRAASKGSVSVAQVAVKYPQGAEKMLLKAVLGREVPVGKLPLDVGVVVHNVGTAFAVHEAVRLGKPLIERVVTVSGPAVSQPRNLWVPIGTPICDLLAFVGLDQLDQYIVISGGPMMGQAQKNLQAPVVKGMSGILVFPAAHQATKEYPCIRCGRCLDACPMFLNPTRLWLLTRNRDIEALNQHHVQACFECGSCSYVCPSHIPLVHAIRMGKKLVREAQV